MRNQTQTAPHATPPTCPPRIHAATAWWLAVTSGWLVSRRRVLHWTLWQCRERFNCVFEMRNQTRTAPRVTPPGLNGVASRDRDRLVVGRQVPKMPPRSGAMDPHFPFLGWHRVAVGRLSSAHAGGLRSMPSAKVPPGGNKVEERSRGLEAFSAFVPPGGKMAESRFLIDHHEAPR